MLNVKKSIICKDVKDYLINKKLVRKHKPQAGDVGIFQVKGLGKHEAIQGTNGNNCYIFPGDYIMATFGSRYATEQFEGYVPKKYYKEYDILGKGGVVGVLASMHEKWEDIGTTLVKLIGYATNRVAGVLAAGVSDSKVINTKYLGTKRVKFNPRKSRPYKVILSLGSNMNSGKTTTAGHLCRGFRRARKKVAFIKLTGTVFAKDKNFVRDCGADFAVDFSSVGFPSTYMCSLPELLNLYETLLTLAEEAQPDVVVVEIADGLLQRETKGLLESKLFMKTVSSTALSAADSMSILDGVTILERCGISPTIVSGLFTTSPLLIEEVQANHAGAVLTKEELATPWCLRQVFNSLI